MNPRRRALRASAASAFPPRRALAALQRASNGRCVHLKERLLEIDAKCVCAHRILNKIVIAEVSDPSIFGLREEVLKAIRDLTDAREILHQLAEEPTNN